VDPYRLASANTMARKPGRQVVTQAVEFPVAQSCAILTLQGGSFRVSFGYFGEATRQCPFRGGAAVRYPLTRDFINAISVVTCKNGYPTNCQFWLIGNPL
jgi:hypothetical protein